MNNSEVKVIVFHLNNETYGVPIKQVISIERMQHITRVPHISDVVKGVMNLRGAIIPVIDMQKRFKMGEGKEIGETRIIIVESDDITVGLMVDKANVVAEIQSEAIGETPEIVGGLEAEYIIGIAKWQNDDLLILLNLQRVLTNEELEIVKQIEV
ncbi:purine-binding chemotaxis protein CheW [Scopulibacillus darangshiensis]|uniref:Purine-binding chemotaxis protein CheW n=1 Tax=Scopulibacillus darangshiensis TaxID=442528 RepID=A0A4R2P609_9BACL|nr:chemotaxis protein CheW [Scopulibacillus darangshiensis]TCP30310.1 purine-binding chemotaxis protein CheW [Scopulibacillus darangshiensis]